MQQVRAVVARSQGSTGRGRVTINVPDPGPGEARGPGPGLRGLPHRPALPRGRHQRRVPVPARPRGRRHRRGRRATASPSVAPGDFVILNWRAVCGDCRACNRGEPWYCFATHNATQKMTLEDGTELSPGPRHRRVRREDPGRGRPVHQGRPGRPAGRGRAAGLRRDGRPRRRDQHRQRRPRQVRRRDRLRRRRCRRHRRLRAGRRGRRSSPSTSTTGSSSGAKSLGATHTVNSTDDRPRRGDPGAHRRQRRRRRHRRGRPPGDLEAGVLRPRPRRHRRPGRRTDARHEDPRPPADRRVRPRRVPEVQLVRRLPALARLPDAGRPLPAGPARPRRVRHRGDRARRRRGGVRQDARTATCCARWCSSPRRCRSHRRGDPADGVRVDHAVVSGTFSLDGETLDVDNNIWVVGDDEECVVIDAPHDVDAILDVVAGRQVKAILCTHAHDDHVRVAPGAARRRRRADPAAPRRPAAVGADPHRRPVGRRPRGRPVDQGRRAPRSRCCTRPGTPPARSASTPTTSAASSPATPCSRAGRAPPAARSATRTRSRSRSGPGCSTLPDETVVHTGHGDDTTIGAEAANI